MAVVGESAAYPFIGARIASVPYSFLPIQKASPFARDVDDRRQHILYRAIQADRAPTAVASRDARITIADMTRTPTINDYLDQLRLLQDKAAQEAKENGQKVISTMNKAGGALRGQTAVQLAKVVETAFHSAVGDMLAALAHIESVPGLDHRSCKHETWMHIQQLVPKLKAASNLDAWYQRLGSPDLTRMIEQQIAALLPAAQVRMKQFEVGLEQPQMHQGTNVTHNTINAHTISGVTQQGGAQSVFEANASIDLGRLATAVSEVDKALAGSVDRNAVEHRQIEADLAAIKAQLAAPTPRPGMIREAIISVRSVAENAVGGALTPTVVLAVNKLAALIG